MNSIDPIEVPLDLPESHMFELERLEAADGRHAIEHKKLGLMDSCPTCWTHIHAMRLVARGLTSPMMEATEKVARKLAEDHQISMLVEATPEYFWENTLRSAGRRKFRQRAAEIIELLELDLAIVPSEKAEV